MAGFGRRQSSVPPGPRSSFLGLALGLNSLGSIALLIGVATALARVRTAENENVALRTRVATAEDEVVGVRRELARSQRENELEEERLAAAHAEELGRATLARAADAAVISDLTRSAAARGEMVAALKAELASLNERLAALVGQPRTPEEDFRRVRQQWDRSIYLIYCEFTYWTTDGGTRKQHTGTGWGTGFLVSDGGHLVTNKHVVEPWKFDSEICAMEALGEVEVDLASVRIAAWPTGCVCLDEKREPLMDRGFNNGSLANLRLVGVAPDHWLPKSMDFGSSTILYKVHELDNNDLAIVKLEGGPFVPVPLADEAPETLDAIMALGFPRGHGGLEARVAVTSPSLGTVRKVEDTIHVTAPIIPGNSGGPLFDRKGRAVGIVTRIYSETLGICLKTSHVNDLLAEVRQKEALAAAAAAESLGTQIAATVESGSGR